jgi:hypothetical protein
VSALEAVVDDGLHAGLNTGHVVSHGVHASLGGVDLDDVLKLSLASLELVLPEFALRLAVFDQLVFWVLSLLEHLLHIALMTELSLIRWSYQGWQCGGLILARAGSSRVSTSLQLLLPSFTSNAFI